jgi:hypothetical protein
LILRPRKCDAASVPAANPVATINIMRIGMNAAVLFGSTGLTKLPRATSFVWRAGVPRRDPRDFVKKGAKSGRIGSWRLDCQATFSN